MSLGPRHLACCGVTVINILIWDVMTAEGDPMETQLCCLVVVYNTQRVARVI